MKSSMPAPLLTYCGRSRKIPESFLLNRCSSSIRSRIPGNAVRPSGRPGASWRCQGVPGGDHFHSSVLKEFACRPDGQARGDAGVPRQSAGRCASHPRRRPRQSKPGKGTFAGTAISGMSERLIDSKSWAYPCNSGRDLSGPSVQQPLTRRPALWATPRGSAVRHHDAVSRRAQALW